MEIIFVFFFFFKQKTAYEITRRDWSSDVCSSDLTCIPLGSRVEWDARRTAGKDSHRRWRSEERRVGKEVPCCVDLGGRRIIKKKITNARLQLRSRAKSVPTVQHSSDS